MLSLDDDIATAISIHPPRVGRDPLGDTVGYPSTVFQSTLPVWGGTWRCKMNIPDKIFQSTLPVWGGTTASTASRSSSA